MPVARVADLSPAAHHSNASPSSLLTKIHPPSFVGTTLQNQQHQSVPPFLDQPMPPHQVINFLVKSEEELAREKEMGKMVLEQKERLEDGLVQRLEELKKLCIAEGELTGQLPEEIYKTLLPDEPEPHVKLRVGTAFKIPQELIEPGKNNEDSDDIGQQLEAEIELNRRIVAAAERLANDRTANKNVRKKRRRDWQAANLRLRGLEKGLNRMRCLSSSKPDVSSLMDRASTIGKSGVAHAGSGFSLNSLRHWPNFYSSIRITTKSCPSTPRGSIPDLTVSTTGIGMPPPIGAAIGHKQTPTSTKKLHNLLKGREDQTAAASALKCSSTNTTITSSSSSSSADSASGGCPSSTSCSSLSLLNAVATIGSSPKNPQHQEQSMSTMTSTSSGISSAAANGSLASSTSNLPINAPPPVPNRRSSAGSTASGRRLTSSRQRRSESRDHGMDRDPGGISKSREDLACHLYANIGYTSSAPYKSAYRQSNFPTLHSPNRSPPQHSMSTSFSPNKPLPVHYNEQLLENHPAGITATASNEMGQIVRQLDSGAHFCPSSALPRHHVQRLAASWTPSSSFSTTSLDRRAMKSGANGSRFITRQQQQQQYCCRIVGTPAKDKSPPPSRHQPATTFPVIEAFRPLQAADFARFRSISALLDRQKKINGHQQRPTPPHACMLPPNDERMETLLASIQQQRGRQEDRGMAATNGGRGGGGDGTGTMV